MTIASMDPDRKFALLDRQHAREAYIIRGVYTCGLCVREIMHMLRERNPGLYHGVAITLEDVEAEPYDGPREECSVGHCEGRV